ncbi:hypothetical protein ACQ9ZF_03905 [Cetobacterium somerae]|uniref:hypothetical protein n=1 Tax=Cetobacterium somerae TaxID=188913 RepID=UPI003D768D04
MLKKILLLMIFICVTLLGKEEKIVISYKENEPILGKNHFLVLSDIPIPTYRNTLGYFSTVNIEGKTLKIQSDLEKIVIKKDEQVIDEKNVIWDKQVFKIEDLDLGGIGVNLKWNSLNKQELQMMLSWWDLQSNNYNLEIEYKYPNKTDILKMEINMPHFNPDIYLNFSYGTPILKRQEYDKKYLIIKKISLNDYDLEITKDKDGLNGLKLKLNSLAKIEETNETIKIIPLIEKYPNIFVEETDENNLFKNSKEIFLALELPKNTSYNTGYKITGDILELNYRDTKKILIDKIILINGKNKLLKTIGIRKRYQNRDKIIIDNLKNAENYYTIEALGKSNFHYKDLNIKIGEIEENIDKSGNSKEIILDFGKLKVENGLVNISIDNIETLPQGKELEYKILNVQNEEIENIKLKLYIEN